MFIWVHSQQQTRHKSFEATIIILHLLFRDENETHESLASGALNEPALLPLCRDLARRSLTSRIRVIIVAKVATDFVLTTAFLAPGTAKSVSPKCPAGTEMAILTGGRHHVAGSNQCCSQNEMFLFLSFATYLSMRILDDYGGLVQNFDTFWHYSEII